MNAATKKKGQAGGLRNHHEERTSRSNLHLPDLLFAAEQAAHLSKALHDLLQLPLPAGALPALARIAGVVHRRTEEAAEWLGDDLGTSINTPDTER